MSNNMTEYGIPFSKVINNLMEFCISESWQKTPKIQAFINAWNLRGSDVDETTPMFHVSRFLIIYNLMSQPVPMIINFAPFFISKIVQDKVLKGILFLKCS